MFEHILIGIDGRRGGRDAIALARRLAAPSASFVLAHVDAGPVSWWDHLMEEERVFDRSASMLAAERERAKIPAAIICVEGASPAHGLHDLAQERAADLIVVGSSRHALLGRVLLGDDARASLDRAPCAVAIAPHGYADSSTPLHEIGLGYDGSPESERALATARELAGRAGAEIKALRVITPANVREEDTGNANWSESVWRSQAEALSDFSRDLDLLIVGSRTHGSLGRVRHGSVPGYLLRHVMCPLLVVPRIAVSAGSAARAA